MTGKARVIKVWAPESKRALLLGSTALTRLRLFARLYSDPAVAAKVAREFETDNPGWRAKVSR